MYQAYPSVVDAAWEATAARFRGATGATRRLIPY